MISRLRKVGSISGFSAWQSSQRILALMLLIVATPLIAMLYLLVKLDSRGPFFYQQRRPGRYGTAFSAYKIRTMCVDADQNPQLAHAVTPDAPEITRVGRYLRDLKLDELPQLWNIVRGEMAFVGPRPIAPSLQSHLEQFIPSFRQRLQVLPGMTNLGQVCIEENEHADNVVEDWTVRFEGEQHYLLNHNMVYDLTIMLLTAGYCLRKVLRNLPLGFQQTAVIMICVAITGCSSSSSTITGKSPITREGYSALAAIPTDAGSAAISVETISIESLQPGIEDPIYRLGPGDRISVNVFGEPGLESVQVQVAGTGDVQLPMLGRVAISGLSLNGVQDLLKFEYGQHFINPWIVVQLTESLSRPVYLLGAFNEAGIIQLERPVRLIQALSEGGGLSDTAYIRGARLIRNGQIAAVDIHGLLNRGRMDQNVWLKPNDTIFIPTSQDLKVYMLGAIARPGAQPVTNGPLTLAQAVSEAGGPRRGEADLQQVRIIRALSPVSGELYVVDYTRIVTGERFDMLLEPGDIVYVPTNGIGSWNDVIEAISPTITLISQALDPFVLAKAIKN